MQTIPDNNSKPTNGKHQPINPGDLRAAMDRKDFTYRSLAEKVGLTQQAVWLLVNGTGRVRTERLKKLCDALDLDFEATEALTRRSGNLGVRVDISRILQAMGEKQMSTYQLAMAVDMRQSYIASILAGNDPKAARLKKVCDALDLDIRDVFITEEVEAIAA